MSDPAAAGPPSETAASAPASAPPVRIAPPATRDPLWFSPVFLLAPARSHSTVVNTMIGSHPRLYGFPELALFRRASVGELMADPPGWRGQGAIYRLAGLLRALAQAEHGAETAETIELATAWLRERGEWRGEQVYDHLLGRVAPRIGVQKSPEDSGRDEYLARVATAYPRARFLHLTRHPRTSAASMHRVWSALGYWDIAPELFYNFCIGVWYFQHLRIEAFVKTLPPDRALAIRSEDVLNEPRETLPRICEWLGIDASGEAIEAMCHPELAPHAKIGPAGAVGGGDGSFLRAPALRQAELPSSLDVPGEWGVDPWLLTSTIELACRLGYRHQPDSACEADPEPGA